MSTTEILTVEQLLAQIDEATAATTAVIENCSEVDWGTAVAEEERPVGVVLHHIANVYPIVADMACQLARGEELPLITYEDVHALNHQHAEAQANVDKAATLAFLNESTAEAKAKLGALSDADLQTSAPLPLIGGQEITTQQMVQWFLINHAHNHIEAIQKTLDNN